MKSRTLLVTAMIAFTPLVVLAFQAQSEQIHKNELKSKSFIQGALKITLAQFIYGSNGINVVVENMSDDSTTFDPRRLSFIDKDGYQVDILGQVSVLLSETVTAEDKKIAPKARIKLFYTLTDRLQLPARLYYEDKLLATIIE